jgi:hypothetical protein
MRERVHITHVVHRRVDDATLDANRVDGDEDAIVPVSHTRTCTWRAVMC